MIVPGVHGINPVIASIIPKFNRHRRRCCHIDAIIARQVCTRDDPRVDIVGISFSHRAATYAKADDNA